MEKSEQSTGVDPSSMLLHRHPQHSLWERQERIKPSIWKHPLNEIVETVAEAAATAAIVAICQLTDTLVGLIASANTVVRRQATPHGPVIRSCLHISREQMPQHLTFLDREVFTEGTSMRRPHEPPSRRSWCGPNRIDQLVEQPLATR